MLLSICHGCCKSNNSVALAIFLHMRYVVLMPVIASAISEGEQTAHNAIRILHAEVLLSDLSMKDIAEASGLNRQTIGRRFAKGSMTLDSFVSLSLAIGVDPICILQQASEKQQKKAPVAAEAMAQNRD